MFHASMIDLGSPLLRHGVYKPASKFSLSQLLDRWKKDWSSSFRFAELKLPPVQYAKKIINDLLENVYQIYKDAPEQEEDFIPEIIDEIREILNNQLDENIEFMLTWPYVQENLDELVHSSYNDCYLSDNLYDLRENLDKALAAMNQGLYIPETSIFVVSNSHQQISVEQFKVLNKAVRYLKDSSFGTEYEKLHLINVMPLEDNSAVACQPYSLTELDWPPCGDLTKDDASSIAQYIRHESGHHKWSDTTPEKVIIHDKDFEFNHSTDFSPHNTPVEWMKEIKEYLGDIEFSNEVFGKNRIDRAILEKGIKEITRLIKSLRIPECQEVLTDYARDLLTLYSERCKKFKLDLLSKLY